MLIRPLRLSAENKKSFSFLYLSTDTEIKAGQLRQKVSSAQITESCWASAMLRFRVGWQARRVFSLSGTIVFLGKIS
jgi:hypothetical protein